METFKIKASSWVAFILTMAVILFAGIKLWPQKQTPALAITYVTILMATALIATRITSRALLEFTISENTIQLTWLKQFLFQKKEDITFNWSDIKSYKYHQDRNYDLFKIELKDGNVIKLWHSNVVLKDDFIKFRLYFEKKVWLLNQKEEKENASQKENLTKIIKEKTFFHTKPGLVVSIFMLLFAISIPIIVLMIPHKAHGSFGMVILGSIVIMIPGMISVLKYFQK